MSEPQKITFLIGTGQLDIDQFLSIYEKGSPLIAADGGANHLYDLNIIPDKIVGDLDSLKNKKYWKEKTEVIYIEEQDSTDLEKVLEQTETPLYLAFGFAGDRFDHTLEILHVLSKYNNKNIIFFAGTDIIFRLPQKWKVELPIGTRLSLYPLHKTKILKSSGLKWPIDGMEMRQGHLIGTSNKATEPIITINQEESNLVCVTHSKHYDKIITSLTQSV